MLPCKSSQSQTKVPVHQSKKETALTPNKFQSASVNSMQLLKNQKLVRTTITPWPGKTTTNLPKTLIIIISTKLLEILTQTRTIQDMISGMQTSRNITANRQKSFNCKSLLKHQDQIKNADVKTHYQPVLHINKISRISIESRPTLRCNLRDLHLSQRH